jgi:hypothetical protein
LHFFVVQKMVVSLRWCVVDHHTGQAAVYLPGLLGSTTASSHNGMLCVYVAHHRIISHTIVPNNAKETVRQ